MGRHRNSLLLPILVGVLAICFTVAILVAWSIIFTKYYLLSMQMSPIPDLGLGYWLILSTGCLLLALVIATLITFLVVNVRQAIYVRQQNAFLDSVTHELKSPLASILLSLDTMELRSLSPERQSKLLGMMRQDVDRLMAFIEHILEASRLEHDERELYHEPILLPALIERSVERVLQRHKVPKNSIRADIAPSLQREAVMLDGVAMDTILTNLIDNAIKYAGGRLDVTIRATEAEPGLLSVEVVDQGIGLERKQLKKVFRRFHRVESPEGKRVRGMGLGLYVVSSLVKRLKGKIQAESPGPGSGTTFRVTLPLERAKDDPQDLYAGATEA